MIACEVHCASDVLHLLTQRFLYCAEKGGGSVVLGACREGPRLGLDIF